MIAAFVSGGVLIVLVAVAGLVRIRRAWSHDLDVMGGRPLPTDQEAGRMISESWDRSGFQLRPDWGARVRQAHRQHLATFGHGCNVAQSTEDGEAGRG